MSEQTVLIVDDNETNLRTLQGTLAELDCRLVFARSGEQALEVARRTRPNLLLLDILMPGMDGFETCRRLRREPELADTAVIFLSALTESEHILRGFQEGGVDYVSKPFHGAEVVARVRTHLELRRRAQELALLNQQKNELLGMVAHDLRNPLVIVGSSLKVLSNEWTGPINADQRELVEASYRSCKRMLLMVEDLLDISVIEAGELRLRPEWVSPAELLEESLRLYRAQALEKGIRLEVETSELPSSVRMDGPKISQVLNNLISNAVKYSSSDSTVRIVWRTDGDRLLLKVADQGQGIPTEELHGIFEPFRQSSAVPTAGESSIGLGLTIVRKIVEGHGGSVAVESAVGRGTTFTVSIPAEVDSVMPGER